jgi:adenylate cyclase
MHDGSRSLLRFDRFTLDPARGCLRVGAEEIALRPKTYDVLRYLARHADRLVPKEEIIAAVWPSVFVTDDSLVHRVTELRQALGDRDQRIIRTVPRRGYRFVAPVSAVADGTVVLHVAERPEVPGGADYAGPAAARPGWPHPRHLAVAAVAALLLLGIGAAGWWRVPRGALEAVGPTTPDRPTVAVLPFDDLGGAARQQRQADAFTEDLIAELARSRELVVIARNSVESFKDKPTDVREIGRRLGVSHMLEGSLQLRPERLRVTAQLVEATTGAHLWTERYDRLAGDLFAVRDESLHGWSAR